MPRIMSAARNPQQTRQRILQAAQQEFAEHGPAGARVDQVAQRAGVNKRMIYHYFDSKDGLFRAVLSSVLADAMAEIDLDGGDLVQHLALLARQEDVLRLWVWEALAATSSVPADSAWGSLLDQLGSELRGAAVDDATGHSLLALLAVALVPAVLGPLSSRVTGLDATSVAFRQGQSEFIERFVRLLANDVAAATVAPAREARPQRVRYRYQWPSR
jgi:TetR/AcrR family transcriptional regulator